MLCPTVEGLLDNVVLTRVMTRVPRDYRRTDSLLSLLPSLSTALLATRQRKQSNFGKIKNK